MGVGDDASWWMMDLQSAKVIRRDLVMMMEDDAAFRAR